MMFINQKQKRMNNIVESKNTEERKGGDITLFTGYTEKR